MEPSDAGVKSAEPRPAGRRRLVTLALAGLTLAAVASDPAGFGRFVLGFGYRGVLVDAEQWSDWVVANRDFFGSLRPGARFALVEDVADSTGLLFERGDHGIGVRKSHLLRFSRVPLVIAIEPQSAAEILAMRMDRDGDRFWDGWKSAARRRRLHAFRYASKQELDRLGLLQFVRGFDVYDASEEPPKH